MILRFFPEQIQEYSLAFLFVSTVHVKMCHLCIRYTCYVNEALLVLVVFVLSGTLHCTCTLMILA
jgi:hypothetical protein